MPRGSAHAAVPTRFGATSTLNCVTPVTLPPGRLRLGTRPSWTGSPPVSKTIGIVVVAAFAAAPPESAGRGNHSHLTTDQIGRHRRQSIGIGPPPSDIRSRRCGPRRSRSRSALYERPPIAERNPGGSGADKPDHRHRRLLRTRRERPSAPRRRASVMNSRRLIRSPRRRAPSSDAAR